MGSSAPLQSAQLLTRHWRIHDAAKSGFEAIDGDGVIGQYPLLIAGQPCWEEPSSTLLNVQTDPDWKEIILCSSFAP